MKNTTNRKNFKNSRAISVLLVAIMLFAALPFAFSVSANSDNGIVYAGGKIKATVEFAKDIPEGVPCYLFEFEYDGSSLSYSETENHWALNPLTVPHPDWDQPALSCSAFTAVGPEVKAGEKLVSFTFDVTKEINVDELSFSYAEFQLYNNDAIELDSSYFAYSVEVLSQGNVPTEPETTVPTEPETTVPTEPETTEPTEPETTVPTEPETTVPTEPETTEPTEPETTVPTEPETTEPTEPETTVPTEPETTVPTELETTEPTEPEITVPTEPETTEPTEPETTEPTEPEITVPTEPETTEPTEPETTVPTEPTPGEPKPIIPDEDVNGDNNNGNVNDDANNNNSNVDNDADNNNSNNSNVNDGATSTPDTIEPNDNGVIKTGVAVSVVSISFIIAIISLAVLFILNNRKNKYNH
ncbi:MAG: hypothetical protein U0L76_09790 [Ruminococcus sp.]|nr:hypothetical protein [Ruminococcus sp.]